MQIYFCYYIIGIKNILKKLIFFCILKNSVYLCVKIQTGDGEKQNNNKTHNTMKAEITMSQLYWNPALLGFFFTKQAQNTLADLLDKAEDRETALEQIDNCADSWGMDADEIGDMFHDMTVKELAAEFEIDMKEEEEEEEEEDWLYHAHDVLDENFPEEDELVKGDFCCEHWQNGLSDKDNIANFKKYVKSIAEE